MARDIENTVFHPIHSIDYPEAYIIRKLFKIVIPPG